MSETSDHPSESTPTAPLAPAPAPPPPPYRPSRLNQVAAWVGIVAGVVFIVAVVFGTGFMVGKHSGHRGFDRDHGPVLFHRGGPPPFPMGPQGQFERPGPGFFPGGPGWQPQPPQPPTTPATPTPARP